MGLPDIYGEYRLGADPELRFTPSGAAVAVLRVVASSRKKQDDNTWVDDKTSWLTAEVWKQTAENVAESLSKGDLVVIIGRLHVREWEDGEGNKRITPTIMVNSLGPSLTFATAKVTRASRSGGQSSQPAASDDPWASSGPTPDDPPF